jgi:hypothetical protein
MARKEKNGFLTHEHNNRILLPLITLLLMIGALCFLSAKRSVFKQKKGGPKEF